MSELPFCPGCTHELIFTAIRDATKDAIVVSDIGCHGIADQHLDVPTFHGLHGRSITYACGIKLARPERRVVVLIGDGGCGIGGAHLLNAARRNVPICVVAFNNFNFGMTGGQHSVTTPCGAKTSTTPEGNRERGFDLARVAEAAGATFVARVTAFDPDLREVIGQGIAHEGFAFLDVWGICTAHFMKRNDLRKAKLVEAAGPKFVRKTEAPVFAPERGSGKPPELDAFAVPVTHRSPLDRRLEIVLAGSAGMRVRTAAQLLARAAVRSGLYATQKDTFPVTVMKGFSLSELILSPEPIDDLQISGPDRLVIVSQDGFEKSRPMHARTGKIFQECPAGIRKTELAFVMGAAALADVLTEEVLRETVEKDGHPEAREKLLAGLRFDHTSIEHRRP